MIIDYVAYNNALTNKSPIKKCLFSMALLLLTMIVDHPFFSLVCILLIHGIIFFVARISTKIYKKLIVIPFSFLALSILVILFSYSPIKEIMIVALPFSKGWVGVTKQGLYTGVELFLRSFSALSAVYLLILTVPFNQLIYVFKKMKMPHEIIELLLLTYRFIFIFVEETEEIYHAQKMRFGYSNIKLSLHSLGLLVSLVFHRVMRRYGEMKIALETKLYNGDFPI